MQRSLRLVPLLLLLATSASAERIRSFDVDIEFTGVDTFRVEERIVYDFETSERRGIFRNIPVSYGRGHAADYRISIDIESVTDTDLVERAHRVRREGRNLSVRIGDPDRRISGVHEYRLGYRVARGLLYFDDHDELYWNITGDAWEVPIQSVRFVAGLPDSARGQDLRVTCFTGRRGSVERACSANVLGSRVLVTADRPLKPHEGLTVAIWLPPGVLERPTAWQRFLSRASDYLSAAFFIPVLSLLGMLELWRRRGRDPEQSESITVRYEPPDGLSPAEVGTLVDERADLTDITASLLDLAVRGHLTIEEVPSTQYFNLAGSDYVLRRCQADESQLREHEQLLLSALFRRDPDEVRLSDLRERFYTRIPGIRKALYQQVTRKDRFFPVSPEHVRSAYRAGGIAVCVLGLAAIAVAENVVWGGSVAAAGLAILAFSPFMPCKTRKGRRAYEHILGLREFIERVDSQRLERMGGRNTENFERILPYAIVLGLSDQWAEMFGDIYEEPPQWYTSRSYSSNFGTRILVRDLGHSMQTVGKTMTSRPASSGSGSSGFGGGGGGFSGGGFGGGGGGSW
jgi:uncharacterized membrane protein YgcG